MSTTFLNLYIHSSKLTAESWCVCPSKHVENILFGVPSSRYRRMRPITCYYAPNVACLVSPEVGLESID
uniref:Ovule protein n=1 Tax=Heterorhabditis bacteriophora TaxID=37862 RepID=A0A1I7WSZ6_HETBA